EQAQADPFGDADMEVREVEAAVEPVVVDLVDVEVADGGQGGEAETELLPDREAAGPVDDLFAVELADDEEGPERHCAGRRQLGVEDRQDTAEEAHTQGGDEHRAREALDEG